MAISYFSGLCHKMSSSRVMAVVFVCLSLVVGILFYLQQSAVMRTLHKVGIKNCRCIAIINSNFDFDILGVDPVRNLPTRQS